MGTWNRWERAGVWAVVLLAAPALGFCDSGRVVFQSRSEGIRATVLAEPTPLRVGPVEIGILLQQENPPRVLTSADVRIAFDVIRPQAGSTPWNGLGCVTPGRSVATSRSHSSNRLLHSALVGLPLPGEWLARVDWTLEHGSGSISFPLTVEPMSPSGFFAWWPFMALVPLAIFVYWRRASLLSARRRHPLRNRQHSPSVGVDGDGRNSF